LALAISSRDDGVGAIQPSHRLGQGLWRFAFKRYRKKRGVFFSSIRFYSFLYFIIYSSTARTHNITMRILGWPIDSSRWP